MYDIQRPVVRYVYSKLSATFALFPVLSLRTPTHNYVLSTSSLPLPLSTPAQLQCLHSGVWEPGNEASLGSFTLVARVDQIPVSTKWLVACQLLNLKQTSMNWNESRQQVNMQLDPFHS